MFKPTLTEEIKRTIPVPESDATVEIRILKTGEVETIRQDTVATSADGEGNMTIGFDLAKRKVATVTACLSNWTGFTSVNGRSLKFTAGNVSKMILESSEFVEWVYEEHEKAFEEAESEEEEVEKN